MYGLDDSGSCRGDMSKGVNVSHHIMSTLLFLLGGDLELFRVEVLKRIHVNQIRGMRRDEGIQDWPSFVR